jgi:hypothetical protein
MGSGMARTQKDISRTKRIGGREGAAWIVISLAIRSREQ